jgi:hypothetical protein
MRCFTRSNIANRLRIDAQKSERVSVQPFYILNNKGRLHMDYSEILDFLAPCGLSCRKCFAYTKGEIDFHSF